MQVTETTDNRRLLFNMGRSPWDASYQTLASVLFGILGTLGSFAITAKIIQTYSDPDPVRGALHRQRWWIAEVCWLLAIFLLIFFTYAVAETDFLASFGTGVDTATATATATDVGWDITATDTDIA